MKTIQRALLLATMFALVLLVVPAAGAKKPLPAEPVPGHSCADYYGEDYQHGLQTRDFEVRLGGRATDYPATACIDVMAEEGEWQVTVEIVKGTVRDLLVAPQDSFSPGDSCGGVGIRKVAPDTVVVLPGPDHPNDLDGDGMIEAAYVNSCGTRFAETIDGGAYGSVDSGTPDPLALRIGMSASRDAEVILHVDLPPTSDPSGDQ